MGWIEELFFTLTHTETYTSYMIIFFLFCFIGFIVYFWFQSTEDFASKAVGKAPKNTTNPNGYNHMNPYDYVPRNPYLDEGSTKEGEEIVPQDGENVMKQPEVQQDKVTPIEDTETNSSTEEVIEIQEHPKEEAPDKEQETVQEQPVEDSQKLAE